MGNNVVELNVSQQACTNDRIELVWGKTPGGCWAKGDKIVCTNHSASSEWPGKAQATTLNHYRFFLILSDHFQSAAKSCL
jgi:hypothetical protein